MLARRLAKALTVSTALAAGLATPVGAHPLRTTPAAAWGAPAGHTGSAGAGLPAPDGFQLAQSRQLSLREVVQIIASQVPGRLSDARLVDQGGRTVYLIRWEPSDESARGRLLEFVVDAESGAILSRRGG